MAAFAYEEYEAKITAVVVLFILYDIVGFFGNVSVLFVYGTRYPKNRFRLLVLALSIVDFTSCCTTVPLETVSTWYYFDPPTRGLCKAKNFFVQLTGLSAMYMLFVTAVYKFRQICKPFKKQITQKMIFVLCCSGIVGSLICALPAGILWDINVHNETSNNKTDHYRICEVHKKYHGTLVPQFYRHLLSAYDIFLLATIVLYFFVAKATVIHFRSMKKRAKKATMDAMKSSSSFASKGIASNFSVDNAGNTKNGPQTNNENDENGINPTGSTTGDSSDNDESADQLPPIHPSTTNKTKRATISGNQPRAINISKVLMMVIIAGTFSVTFLMALTFAFVFAIRGLQDYSSVDEYVALFTCYRFYFINYAMNPVVYFSLDRRFRDEVINILTCYRRLWRGKANVG